MTEYRLIRVLRAHLSELLGAFSLTLVAAGGGVIAAVSGGKPDLASQVVAPGLLVMALIYTLGPTSGAHFNPAVTLAFALRANFPWRFVPGYWAVQMAGAVLAALLLRSLFGTAGHLGDTLPHHGTTASLVIEIVLTFLLVTVILATAANFRIVGHNAAIAVGGTIILDGLFAAPISGASMNPARSLGPEIVGGDLQHAWIYVVGPFLGAIIAVVAAFVLRGPGSAQASAVAAGDSS